METFEIAIEQTGTHTVALEKAVHTDTLNDRKGYDPAFLGTALSLPKLKAGEENDLPVLTSGIGPNGDRILDYTHFSIAFNTAKKMPYYTAVNIYGKTNMLGMVHEERDSDSWYQDERISSRRGTVQYGNKDYKGSGFAKGHLVRYYDPAWGSAEVSKIAIGDTFHYTNACPQIPYFNGVVWNYLEDYCIARSIFQDNKITLFAGPIFNKARQINGLLAPMNFWKILVYEKEGQLRALGFLMSQEPYLSKLKPKPSALEKVLKQVQPTLTRADIERLFKKQELFTARIKIALIEEKTGLSFGLNAADEYRDKGQYEGEPINQPGGGMEKSLAPQMSPAQLSEFLKAL
ncbi:DNA/RNA non-specific endonuclease [Mucilaginibacter sp. R-33]|uniref:DNA/RNA non-specific endonuclease n=1 Tax=Mucilaginibacter sp. R-33 TaxID=3416711 RepID=UPI003CF386F5